MEKLLYGDLGKIGLEVIERGGRMLVRCDAGTHQVALREDEITPEELELIAAGGAVQERGMFALQARLTSSGTDAYVSNWPSA